MNDFDWNFDAVPDAELVACCYWEYARESAFIRDVRRRCGDGKWKDMLPLEAWSYVGKEVEQLQSIGYHAEVFLRGFFFDEQEDKRPKHPDAPRITGSFPNAWQSLSAGEREYRSHIRTDVEILRLQPFKRAHWGNAWDLMERAKARQREAIEADYEAHAQHPGVSEFILRKRGILKDPPEGLSVFWVGDNDEPNKEVTMVEIEWANFTNEQIVQCFRKWVAENRPNDVSKPDKRGHKPKDWRVALERLGMLRLLHRFQLSHLPKGCPEAWKLYSRREWYKERKRAGEMFRKLFPFLSKSEHPLNWPTKGDRSGR